MEFGKGIIFFEYAQGIFHEEGALKVNFHAKVAKFFAKTAKITSSILTLCDLSVKQVIREEYLVFIRKIPYHGSVFRSSIDNLKSCTFK